MKNHIKKDQLHKRLETHKVWQIIRGLCEQQVHLKVACQWLGLEKSRVYELVKRYKKLKSERVDPVKESARLYVRSRQPHLRIQSVIESFLAKELEYFKNQSPFFKGHFNFAYLAEQCHKRFGVKLHRNSLRRWAVREGYFNPLVHTTKKIYQRFEAGAIGLLVQHDTSKHIWLPHTKMITDLILTIDDHSRKILAALLVPVETAWHHMCTVRHLVELYGLPIAYYLDNHLIYGRKNEFDTDFSRALSALKINLKFTAKQYPQAKGKVEKRFDYFQRRLPALFERYKITSLTKANLLLQEQVQYFNEHHIHAETKQTPNQRWEQALKEGRTYFREIPKGIPLDIIFSLHYPRNLRPDGTVTFAGKIFPLPKLPFKTKITVALKPPTHKRHHTELFFLHENKTVEHVVLPGSLKKHFFNQHSLKSLIKNRPDLPDTLSLKRLTLKDILGPK